MAPPHPGNTLYDGLTLCRSATTLVQSAVERPADVIFALDEMLAANHVPAFLVSGPLMAVAGWRAHYDPRIAEPFAADKDLELWSLYDAVRCPTLLLRGELSDLLMRDTAEEMARRGPRARMVEIRGVGHAPTLLHPEQIALVREFFLEGASS